LPATSPTIEPRALLAVIRRLDDETVAWLARTDHGVLRPVLRATARASDVLAPFVAIGACAVRDGTSRSRTAVVRGGVVAATPLGRDADLAPSGALPTTDATAAADAATVSEDG
jgi:hypothetical protein